VPVLAAKHAHRDLLVEEAPGDRLDQELGCVELGLQQFELGQQIRADRAKAVRAVGDRRADEQADQAIEQIDSQLAGERAGLGAAENARSLHPQHPSIEDRRRQCRDLLGAVLTVGVHRDDQARSGLNHQRISHAQGGPAAPVLREARHDRAGAPRGVCRVVGGTVVDHEHRRGHAADVAGHLRQELYEVLALVVCGDHDRHAAREALWQLAVAQRSPGGAEQRSVGGRRKRRGGR